MTISQEKIEAYIVMRVVCVSEAEHVLDAFASEAGHLKQNRVNSPLVCSARTPSNFETLRERDAKLDLCARIAVPIARPRHRTSHKILGVAQSLIAELFFINPIMALNAACLELEASDRNRRVAHSVASSAEQVCVQEVRRQSLRRAWQCRHRSLRGERQDWADVQYHCRFACGAGSHGGAC